VKPTIPATVGAVFERHCGLIGSLIPDTDGDIRNIYRTVQSVFELNRRRTAFVDVGPSSARPPSHRFARHRRGRTRGRGPTPPERGAHGTRPGEAHTGTIGERLTSPLLVRRPAEYRETARRTTWRKTRHDDAGTPDGSKYIKSIFLKVITLKDTIINISTMPPGSETKESSNRVLASNTGYNTF
jgi:hypothetical protein